MSNNKRSHLSHIPDYNHIYMLSETNALEKLHTLKTDFADRIRAEYEHRAKSCLTCETKGACCLDAHFVNVRISRLEAVAIGRVIDELSNRDEVLERVERTVVSEGFFACPLFEKGLGCLVHERGKPLPCITHACYENKEDLPPDELLEEQEVRVERLNRAVCGKAATSLPLPIAISRRDFYRRDAESPRIETETRLSRGFTRITRI